MSPSTTSTTYGDGSNGSSTMTDTTNYDDAGQPTGGSVTLANTRPVGESTTIEPTAAEEADAANVDGQRIEKGQGDPEVDRMIIVTARNRRRYLFVSKADCSIDVYIWVEAPPAHRLDGRKWGWTLHCSIPAPDDCTGKRIFLDYLFTYARLNSAKKIKTNSKTETKVKTKPGG